MAEGGGAGEYKSGRFVFVNKTKISHPEKVDLGAVIKEYGGTTRRGPSGSLFAPHTHGGLQAEKGVQRNFFRCRTGRVENKTLQAPLERK